MLELDERWRAIRAAARGAARRAEPGQRGPQGPADARGARAAGRAGRPRARAQRRGGRRARRARRRARGAAEPAAPDAPDEDTVLREVGEAGATGRDHLELAGPRIDMEAAARAVGVAVRLPASGDLVLLEFALVRFALEKLRGEGFEPVIPPVLVRERALYGTGLLPGHRAADLPRSPDDDLYLVGTSEVALASLHAEGDPRPGDALPLRYAGFSTCFRREAGAAGKDTRGIFRVHQFDKVEMFSFVEPEEGQAEHERLLAIEESILQRARDPLPRRRDRGRRPGRVGGQEVRLRGLAARPGRATAS